MKSKRKSPRFVPRRIISAEKLIGPIHVVKEARPVFLPDGGGNGWYCYEDGSRMYCYFR